MSSPRGGLTPMMEQYHRIKQQHPDRVLLYRMGDFYETFYDDAVLASRVLGITLTTRGKSQGQDVPLAGVPHHSVNTYIQRLIRAGHSVAICEQVEDPALAKGVVKREVVEVITPGTVAIEEFLPEHQGAYCLSLNAPESKGAAVGYALADISTGELLVGQDRATVALGLPARYSVRELIYPEGAEDLPLLAEMKILYPGLHYAPRRAWDWLPEEAEQALARHFGVRSSEVLGFREREDLSRAAAGAMLVYLHELKGEDLAYFDRVAFLREEENMVLDRVTVENLELMRPLRGEERDATLFGQINRCASPMGARLLSRWLLAPLLNREAILARQDAVAALHEDQALRKELGAVLKRVADLERLVSRLTGGKTRPRDLGALLATLELLPALRELLAECRGELLVELREGLDDLPALCELLNGALAEELPAKLGEGGVIASGHDAELDRLRGLSRDGRSWILALQEKERTRTGIAKLKVGYNKVFGYYLEVSRGQAEKVPEDFIIKQTLTGSFRYITPELKSREEEILGAEERMHRREAELFENLRERAYGEHLALQANARVLATLDCLRSLAELALRQRYVRPEILAEARLEIADGRHPVVEILQAGEFIPNDLDLDTRREQIHLITGPNMGGKSTFLRQTALVAIMAQMGGYVPAAAARVGIADKVFTRVGASDNLARGQSTFLIEMEETATILRNLTERSLVILDEIGRGTSTYDGLSLAWAVIEDLHREGGAHPRTLFATHYHELTGLEQELERLRNYHVTVKEWQDEIVFLRKVEPGAAGRSYGIHVAKLAGLPPAVIERAFEILRWIEQSQTLHAGLEAAPRSRRHQLDLFAVENHPVLDELRALDLTGLTPLEALNVLNRFQAALASEERPS